MSNSWVNHHCSNSLKPKETALAQGMLNHGTMLQHWLRLMGQPFGCQGHRNGPQGSQEIELGHGQTNGGLTNQGTYTETIPGKFKL